MAQFALSAIGRDRPGIVAGLSRCLLDHGLNIEDSQMTILRGRFTVMLIVAGGEDIDEHALRGDLQRAATELGLDALHLEAVAETDAHGSAPTHIVSVYGVDHPGIVHAVADALARERVNITDLYTRLVDDAGAGGENLYAMMLEVAPPSGVDRERLAGMLAAVGEHEGVEVSVRELEADAL